MATRKHTCPLADTHIRNPAVQLSYSTCERNTNRDETSGRMKTRAGKGVNTHTAEAPRPCELLTLIRAAEGLTPGGRPPSHSRDGHSPPVNPPGCKRRPTKSCRMWDSHKRGFKSQARTKRRTHNPCQSCSGDSSWPVRHRDETVLRHVQILSSLLPEPLISPSFLKLFLTAMTNTEGHMKK